MSQHEQSYADAFNAFMRSYAAKYGFNSHSFSADGQDRRLGADYVLTDSDRFSLIEFKYSNTNLINERHKPRRIKLCRALDLQEHMRDLHDKCHFIFWTEGYSLSSFVNIYRHEICNRKVCGYGCDLSAMLPILSTRSAADIFAQEFFNPTGSKSLNRKNFEIYLAWLLTEVGSSSNSNIEIVTYNTISNDLALVRLNSISEAQKWVIRHLPSLT